MIRFIDLRGQDTGNRFMFWDTVTDQPIEADGEFAWNTSGEFEAAAQDLLPSYQVRLLSLCPSWTEFYDPATENRTVAEGAPCVLCALNEPGPDHRGPCMSRNELMTELAGLP